MVVATQETFGDDAQPDGRARDGAREIPLRAQLVERLRGEFANQVAVDHIQQVVDDAIASLSAARVRTFVSVLAWRRARANLRAFEPTAELDSPA